MKEQEGLLDFSVSISCIYGLLVASERAEFLKLMKSLSPRKDGMWLCVGDLNALIAQSEKYGGRINGCGSFMHLQKFLHVNYLIWGTILLLSIGTMDS